MFGGKLVCVAYGNVCNWAWWQRSVISKLGRLKREDHELEVRLDYIVRP
jgi:hypothetical protein